MALDDSLRQSFLQIHQAPHHRKPQITQGIPGYFLKVLPKNTFLSVWAYAWFKDKTISMFFCNHE